MGANEKGGFAFLWDWGSLSVHGGCKHHASVLVRGLSMIAIPECFLKQQVSDVCCFMRLLLFVWAQCFPWPQARVGMGEKTNRSVSWTHVCSSNLVLGSTGHILRVGEEGRSDGGQLPSPIPTLRISFF